MFQSFDYGKSLLKQLEAYRRLPAPQQQKRHPAMVKQLEQYAQKFLQEITKSGSSNPGMLKNGAEAMIEAAYILQEPIGVYTAFAEMAGRSRKVPVVPGLAQMVDKLLEMATPTKKERATLLSWRIVTGTMRPERHIKYLAERAHLTESGNDWKEYAYGLIQLVRKDSIKLTDELVSVALSDLLASKSTLGDQSLQLQLLAAESLIMRKNLRQAEQVLIDLANEGNHGNQQVLDMALLILDARADSSWELHQLSLTPMVRDFVRSGLPWNQLSERLHRARMHSEQMAQWLCEYPEASQETQLAEFTTLCILDLPAEITKLLLNRWQNILAQNGWSEASVNELFKLAQHKLKERGAVPQPLQVEAPAKAAAKAPAAKKAEEAPKPAAPPVVERVAPPPSEPEVVVLEAPAPVFAEPVAPPPPELLAIEAEPVAAAAVMESASTDVIETVVESPAEVEYDDVVAEAAASLVIEEDAIDEAVPQVAPLEVPEAVTAMAPAPEPEPEPELEPEPEPEPVGAMPAALRNVLAALPQNRDTVRQVLAESVKREGLTSEKAAELQQAVSDAPGPDWSAVETRLWLVEQLLYECDADGAAALFEPLAANRDGKETAQLRLQYVGSDGLSELLARLYTAAGSADLPAEIAIPASRLALAYDDWARAIKLAQNLEPADPARKSLFGEIEQWLITQREPAPEMLMGLAKAQREHMDEDHAGFEAATTAALLAPDNEEIQLAYAGWTSTVNEYEKQRQRAQQATYFCAREGRHELLSTAVDEITALAEANAEPEVAAAGISDKQLQDWLEQLRPVLDKSADAKAAAVKFKWTRSYLTLMARGERRSQLPAALKQASSELQPTETLELVYALANELPAAARVEVECDSLMRQGAWERAVEVFGSGVGSTGDLKVGDNLGMIYGRLPSEWIVPASRMLTDRLAESGQKDAQLEVIKYLHEHFVIETAGAGGSNGGGNGKSGNGSDHVENYASPEVDVYIEEALAGLIAQRFEPALRYRLTVRKDEANLEQSVRDLMELVRQGDPVSADPLGDAVLKLAFSGGDKDLLLDAAGVFASSQAVPQPDRVVEILCRAALAANNPAWAIERSDSLGIRPTSASSLAAMGAVAVKLEDYDLALGMVEALNQQRAYRELKPLLDVLQQAKPDSEVVLMALLLQTLVQDQQDLPAAFGLLLQLAQVLQSRSANLAESLTPVREPIEALSETRPGDLDGQLLQIALFASTGQLERASRLVQEAVKSGPQAANRVLALFDRLALHDADLPSGMVLAWGQALFDTGRFAEALDRIAGLRNAVGEYPEYMALLEEIKKSGGGAGASMQLAEAYMRVHLWPRSADEYAQALTEDVHLAEPILTQLRNHGALDPHPMKYPLQVVALRAVAESSREADWQWALSAMTWLTPRWSAEELYDIGRRLHQKVGNVELEKSQIVDLLLNLHHLALRAGDAGAALDYLSEAWGQRDHSDQDLPAILRSFDTSKLPEDPALWVKFRLMELQVALTKGEQPAILEIARQMATLGQAGRSEAQKVLAKYEATLEDPVLVRVERLKLLDLDDPKDQNEFVEGLLSVGKAELPVGVARELARMALKLASAAPGIEERQRLLLLMLRKLGDYARAWQLALWHVGDPGQTGKEALALMEDAASSEFAVSQQVDLVEAYLRRGETERAGAALERLQWANLGETPSGEPLPESLGQRAADLAEALLTMVPADDPAAHASRRWLVNWYRERGHTAMAADHLLWAHVSGLHLPAAWMHDSESADLLYRSGLLYEAAGTPDLALKQYKRARLAKGSDDMVPALVRLRLSGLAEEKGEIHEAYELAQEALDLDPSGVLAKKRVDSLKRHIFQHQVEMARNQPDSAQRSLAIARLQRSAGELSEAISELQAAIGRGQNDAEVYVELAECFVENGEFNIARRAYNEVLKRLEVENREPELRLRALYGLATAEEELDKPDQAILLLEQILVIRHNYRDSRQRLDRLYAGEFSFGPGMGPDRAARAKTESDTGDILDELLALLRDPGDNPNGGGKR